MPNPKEKKPPLVAHIVYRFDYGGLENGLVNLINTMPADAARHVVISLTEPGGIVQRLTKTDVAVHNLQKKPGKDPAAYIRLFRLLRTLNPDVVHTRNFGTLDCQLVAFLAGVPNRLHGEHGWDVHDPLGKNRKYRYLRRLLSPLVHKFIVLSHELQMWMIEVVGISSAKVERICNGVDTDRFKPSAKSGQKGKSLVFGSVTRFTEIKDPLNTIKGFIQLESQLKEKIALLKLLMVGNGYLRADALDMISESGMEQNVCLVGSQLDVGPWLEKMDVFVMGSKREGISNTILEAMASGLPVIATNTGGNPELVEAGQTGMIVETENPNALAEAMATYSTNPDMISQHGRKARERVLKLFSLKTMVDRYTRIYNPSYIS